MASLKYSYYSAADSRITGGATWAAQTFTTDTSVDRIVKRLGFFTTRSSGSSGNLYLALRATDGSGHPTGSNLCSATLPYNVINTSTQEWVEADVSVPYTMAMSTKYAFLFYTDSAQYAEYFGTSDAFAGGNREGSTNSGSTWTAANYDGTFRIYTDPMIIPSLALMGVGT